MKKFCVVSEKCKSVVRSVRIKNELNEQLLLLSKATKVSYNKLVNKAIEYALKNI